MISPPITDWCWSYNLVIPRKQHHHLMKTLEKQIGLLRKSLSALGFHWCIFNPEDRWVDSKYLLNSLPCFQICLTANVWDTGRNRAQKHMIVVTQGIDRLFPETEDTQPWWDPPPATCLKSWWVTWGSSLVRLNDIMFWVSCS